MHDRALKEYLQQQELTQAEYRKAQQRYAQLLREYPADAARQNEAREKIAEMEKAYAEKRNRDEMQKSGTDRKAKLIYKVEPTYTEDARAKQIEGTVLLGFTADHEGVPRNIQVKRSLFPSLDQAAITALRQWRFEPGMKDGQPVSTYLTVEMNFAIESKRIEQRQKETESAEKVKAAGQELEALQMKRRKDASDQGREERARRQVEMTRGATISMDRAVQIAVSQYPGKVLAASLGRDGDKIFYHLVIINTEGDKSTTTYVWLSATDGQIFKTEKERDSREQQW